MSQQHPPGWHPGMPPAGYPHQPHVQHPPYGQPGYGAPGYGYGSQPQPPPQGGGSSAVRIVVGVLAGLLILGALGVGGAFLLMMNESSTTGSRSNNVSTPDRPDPLAQERAALLANPNSYLKTSDFINYDKGIINDYRQLVGVTVLNRSHFAVWNMSGDVEWVNDSGARVASMPFTLKGSIAAGDTKKFSQTDGTFTNGTVQSSARRVHLNFTHVDIVE